MRMLLLFVLSFMLFRLCLHSVGWIPSQSDSVVRYKSRNHLYHTVIVFSYFLLIYFFFQCGGGGGAFILKQTIRSDDKCFTTY